MNLTLKLFPRTHRLLGEMDMHATDSSNWSVMDGIVRQQKMMEQLDSAVRSSAI